MHEHIHLRILRLDSDDDTTVMDHSYKYFHSKGSFFGITGWNSEDSFIYVDELETIFQFAEDRPEISIQRFRNPWKQILHDFMIFQVCCVEVFDELSKFLDDDEDELSINCNKMKRNIKNGNLNAMSISTAIEVMIGEMDDRRIKSEDNEELSEKLVKLIKSLVAIKTKYLFQRPKIY